MKKRVMILVMSGIIATGMSIVPVQAKGEDTYEVVMQWPAVGDTPSGLEAVEEKANEILKDKGITLTLEPVNAFNLATETSLAVSSGEKLDLSVSLYSGVGSLVNNGSILELDDLLEEYGQDILSTCNETQMTGGMYNGQIYGIPVAYINGNDQAFICRTDVLKDCGIEIENDKYYTFDELEEIFAKVKEVKGDSFYMVAGGLDANTNFPFMAEYCIDTCGQSAASGAVMLDHEEETPSITNVFASDEYEEYANRMYEWNQKGYFSPDASTDTESATTLIGGGNYLGTFANYCGESTLVELSGNTGYDCTAIRVHEAVSRSNEFSSILWSIPSTCDNPEKTMEFLDYLYSSEELTNLLRYGIEGVSYEVVESDENGTVIQFPEGMNASSVPYYQQFGIYGNRLKWYAMSPNKTTLNKELQEFRDSVTKKSSVLGYTFNIDNVSNQYSAVDSVISQYAMIINSGSIDPKKELPEFLSALKTAGIDEVIAENQKQLEQWIKDQNA